MKARTTLLIVALCTASSIVAADEYVNGYYRQNGTYVAPHHRTAPDPYRANNYGSQGMVNPYTGQQGTVNPYSVPVPRPVTPPPYNPWQR